MRITKSFVDKVSTPPLDSNGKATQIIHRDSAIVGFGLRVTSTGVKSFIVETRINGKSRRKTLGRYGRITVEQARKEAVKFLGKVAQGSDPIAERKADLIKSVDLITAFEDYLITRKDLKESTIHDYRRHINGAFSDWKKRPLTDITKDMVESRHRTLGQKSKARANGAMRVLRAIYNHSMAKYEDEKGVPIIGVNPVERISQIRAWYKIEPRRTLIKAHQIADWYQGTLQLNNEGSRDYLHLILLTGLRRSEASRLSWDDIDFKDDTLIVTETKNHRTHTLSLSDFLREMLKRRFINRSSMYVFPSETDTGYMVDPSSAIKRVVELSKVKFTLHDLRRTFITIAEQIDISAYALKQLLNHKDANDVTAGYIVIGVDRLRKPMQAITDYIVRAAKSEDGNIIQFKKIVGAN